MNFRDMVKCVDMRLDWDIDWDKILRLIEIFWDLDWLIELKLGLIEWDIECVVLG